MLTSPAAAIQFNSHAHRALVAASGNDADARGDDGGVNLTRSYTVRVRVANKILQGNATGNM